MEADSITRLVRPHSAEAFDDSPADRQEGKSPNLMTTLDEASILENLTHVTRIR